MTFTSLTTHPKSSFLSQITGNPIAIVFFLGLSLLTSLPLRASGVLILEPNQRLEASICADSMNRIAVANDRITQIFGDEGTFESQNDENTGQVFLKPTTENGSKNLSITLITEQGITQDLTLKPTAKSATTLILKNNAAGVGHKTGERSSQRTHEPSFTQPEGNSFSSGSFASLSSERNLTLQDYLLVLLKQAVTKQLPLQEKGFFDGNDISRPSPNGLKLNHHLSYTVPPFGVYVFDVENTISTSIEVEEKSFYQVGDLAISLEQRALAPQTSTLLYVVTWESQHHD